MFSWITSCPSFQNKWFFVCACQAVSGCTIEAVSCSDMAKSSYKQVSYNQLKGHLLMVVKAEKSGLFWIIFPPSTLSSISGVEVDRSGAVLECGVYLKPCFESSVMFSVGTLTWAGITIDGISLKQSPLPPIFLIQLNGLFIVTFWRVIGNFMRLLTKTANMSFKLITGSK